MLLSYDWLKSLVPLTVSPDEFALRMMMAGFNHESTTSVGGDVCVDLEITSNRPDCLGHIGLAREAAVLFGSELKLPAAAPKVAAAKVADLAQVQVDSPKLCPRYTARVIRGVKVGPSPAWLQKRLTTVGIACINNVVDITNYVLMECGQPLHAFDLAKLAGRKIIVRDAKPGEKFAAINHKSYDLAAGMCVIADAERPIALAGVMGGADTEVSNSTTELLIESADFYPLSVRIASRKLALRSDSSYRFERGVDPEGIDWASRRCCELILELCGGELADGVIDVDSRELRGKSSLGKSITLRFAQLKRILGIDIPAEIVRQILFSLGNKQVRVEKELIEVIPPSWRRDLEREIDLIEEAARIYGYDKIPEDVSVPMSASARTEEDRVLAKVRSTLTACGFDEALTISVVDESLSSSFSPWTDAAPLATQMPILERADKLRRSLVPSLLKARRDNEAVGNRTIELFETAKVYLPRAGELPQEDLMLGLTSGRDFFEVKGTLEAIVAALNPTAQLTVRTKSFPLFTAGRGCEVLLGDQVIGVLGEVSGPSRRQFDLRGPTVVAELKLAPLVQSAVMVPRYVPLPAYPTIERDLNLIVDEAVRWSDVAATVRSSGGDLLASFDLKGEPFRDEKKIGAGKKSLLVAVLLQSHERTLTGTEADDVHAKIVDACAKHHAATLRV